MERRSRRPSPAMLVAMIALSLTLGGSAIAADTVSKKDVKKIAKKQAKKQIKKLSPRAYALIEGDSVLSDAPSKGITSADVSSPVTGFSCINLDFNPVTGAATEGGGGIKDGFASLSLASTEFDECPTTAEAEVTHFDSSAGDFSTDPVQVQFDG
jgi:hypothetical protein